MFVPGETTTTESENTPQTETSTGHGTDRDDVAMRTTRTTRADTGHGTTATPVTIATDTSAIVTGDTGDTSGDTGIALALVSLDQNRWVLSSTALSLRVGLSCRGHVVQVCRVTTVHVYTRPP